VPLTLVVLSTRLGAVLPAAALPALRAAERIRADHTVPDEVLVTTGAERLSGWVACRPLSAAGPEVLLTTDAEHPLRAHAGTVIGTPEPPGAALLDAVAVMDRLRSPGGCPWDAEQTHLTLLKYLVEECYELYQAVEDADRPALCEELGDVLLQVLFHARVAAEGGVAPFPPGTGADAGVESEPFGIDEVAGGLVRKLVDRHPHVFGDGERIATASDQEKRWDELKRVEKRRESSVDGVAHSQPAAALAAKLVSRARKAGLPDDLSRPAPPAAAHRAPSGERPGEQVTPEQSGSELFGLVAELSWNGVDAERELRRAALRFGEWVRDAEAAARAAGLDPHRLTAEDWRRYWPA
jgi:XTP/dITP diphosphohydrolase